MVIKQDKRSVLTISMWRDVRNCRPTIAKISPLLCSDSSFRPQNGGYRSFILFFFFIILCHLLSVKWFLTDYEWFTVSLKTPGSQVSKRPCRMGVNDIKCNKATRNPVSFLYDKRFYLDTKSIFQAVHCILNRLIFISIENLDCIW